LSPHIHTVHFQHVRYYNLSIATSRGNHQSRQMRGFRRLFSGQIREVESAVDQTAMSPKSLSRKVSKLKDLSGSVVRRMGSVGRRDQQENPSNVLVSGLTRTGDQSCFQPPYAPVQSSQPRPGRSELQDRALPEVLLPGRKQIHKRKPLHSTIPEERLLHALDTGDLGDLQPSRPTMPTLTSLPIDPAHTGLPHSSAFGNERQSPGQHHDAITQPAAPRQCFGANGVDAHTRQPGVPSIPMPAQGFGAPFVCPQPEERLMGNVNPQRQSSFTSSLQAAKQERPALPPKTITFEAILGYDSAVQLGQIAGNHALSLQSAVMSGLLSPNPGKSSRPSDFIIKKRFQQNLPETTWAPSSRSHAAHGYSRDSWSPLDEQRKFSTRDWSISELIPRYLRIAGHHYEEEPVEQVAAQAKPFAPYVQQQPCRFEPFQPTTEQSYLQTMQQCRAFLVPTDDGYWVPADPTGSNERYGASTAPVQSTTHPQRQHESLFAPNSHADMDKKTIREEFHFDLQVAPRNFSLPTRAADSPPVSKQSTTLGHGEYLAIDFASQDDDEEDWTASIARAAARVSQGPSNFPTPSPSPPAAKPAERPEAAPSSPPTPSNKKSVNSDTEEPKFDPMAYPLLNALDKPLPPPAAPVKQVRMYHIKDRYEPTQRWFSWKAEEYFEKGK
jgi:hypothetical protein